jgi:hypothetical protein
METATRYVGTSLILAVLLGLLAVVGWFAFAGVTPLAEAVPSDEYPALILGALSAVLVGIGWMTVVFYSGPRDYDEPPRMREDL